MSKEEIYNILTTILVRYQMVCNPKYHLVLFVVISQSGDVCIFGIAMSGWPVVSGQMYLFKSIMACGTLVCQLSMVSGSDKDYENISKSIMYVCQWSVVNEERIYSSK